MNTDMVMTAYLWGWDWGTTAEWFAGLATVAAVVVALVANRMTAAERAEAKKEREEAAEDRARFRRIQDEEAMDRRRELARQVSVTFQAVRQSDQWDEPTNNYRLHVTITNHGPSPITHVQVYFGRVTHHASPLDDLWTIPPGVHKRWSTDDQEHFRDRPRLKVYFRDARGVHWIRDLAGYLWEHDDISREPRNAT